LLSLLREKSNNMSEMTKTSHESLAKALTIHAILPIYVCSIMTIFAVAQLYFEIHSLLVESFEYEVAVLPTLIHPCLTLYFVRPYRM
ncbi:hypothetical protein PMAYCL1PPCAC_16272, partial [Pristionchus mayeri]